MGLDLNMNLHLVLYRSGPEPKLPTYSLNINTKVYYNESNVYITTLHLVILGHTWKHLPFKCNHWIITFTIYKQSYTSELKSYYSTRGGQSWLFDAFHSNYLEQLLQLAQPSWPNPLLWFMLADKLHKLT